MGCGDQMDMVQFVTNLGRTSQQYGNPEGGALQPEIIASEGNQIFSLHRERGYLQGVGCVEQVPAPVALIAQVSFLEDKDGITLLFSTMGGTEICSFVVSPTDLLVDISARLMDKAADMVEVILGNGQTMEEVIAQDGNTTIAPFLPSHE